MSVVNTGVQSTYAVESESRDFWSEMEIFPDTFFEPVQQPLVFVDSALVESDQKETTSKEPPKKRRRASRAARKSDGGGGGGGGKRKPVKRRRKSQTRSASKKTLVAPKVLERLPKIKKYPGNFKRVFDATLQSNGVHFEINSSIRTMMIRPATKDVGKYWYVLWQFIFAYVAQYPQYTLERCSGHVTKLLNAQKVAMEHFETMKFDRKPQTRLLARNEKCAKSLPPPPSRPPPPPQPTVVAVARNEKCADSPSVGARAATMSVSSTDDDTQMYRSIFQQVETQVEYRVDPTVADIVRNVPSDTDLKVQLQMFECCWMYIFSIVERLGEMYLKRSCLNGNIVQLAEAQSAFVAACKQRSVAAAMMPLDALETCTVSGAIVSAVREDLRKAFDALRSNEIKS